MDFEQAQAALDAYFAANTELDRCIKDCPGTMDHRRADDTYNGAWCSLAAAFKLHGPALLQAARERDRLQERVEALRGSINQMCEAASLGEIYEIGAAAIDNDSGSVLEES